LCDTYKYSKFFLIGDSKKARMKRKKDKNSTKEAEKSQEKRGEADHDDVYQISSVDEDCSKGMQSINYLIWDIYLCAFDFS
jgi:hypothetical protein